jgi:hypothetical protein
MLYIHGGGGGVGGVPTRHPSSGSNGSTSTTTSSKTVTLTNTTTTVTITKTYTQVVTKTYVINHYIEYYMYPIIKWVFTLVNIGYEQAPGYHTIGSEELFTPGFGGSGIFVPVYAQEAIYVLNIAPSTKPQITGWYVGSTSESSSPPSLASQSVNTYLSGIQKTVNTIRHQYKVTLTNTTKTTTYWNYITITQPSPTGTNKTGPSNSTSPQPTTNPESWITFWKAGPGGVGGTTVTNYGPGGVTVTYKPPVFGPLPPINLPPGLLPPGVNSPPGFHNKFIHSGALAGVPIIGEPVTLPISGLGSVLSSVGNAILNGIKNGLGTILGMIHF